MNNQNYKKNLAKKHFASSIGVTVALCALTTLGGRAAQAGATQVTNPSQLGNTVQTSPFPSGDVTGTVSQSFTVAAGSNNVTFTATAGTAAQGFESFIADGTVDFPVGQQLEDTTRTSPTGNIPTGPLQIDFTQGVTGFGLNAQDFNFDMETFTLNVYGGPNGTVLLNAVPFTFGPVDNTSSVGRSVFVGALSNDGPLITRATLSSFSVAAGQNPNNGSNDFYFGPTSVKAPVPEASTVVSFGMGVFLFAGLALVARRRKVSTAS